MTFSNDPLVCQTDRSTRQSRWIVAPVFLAVALYALWSGVADTLPPVGRLFVFVWIGAAVCIGIGVLARGVTRIQVDEDGVCTFRAPLRVVATCTVADVSDIRMPVNGRTLRLRASGRKVTVLLPMDGLATFLSRVKAAHGPDDPPAEESTEPLVLRTEARALRFQAIVWAVFPVAASYVVWSWSHDAHSAFFKVLVLAWIGFVAWIALRYMRRATTIEVDPSGRCTFRTWAGIVATWPLEEVSEIRLLRDGRTMSLHASGRTVLVTLPMDGISAFVARVRAANPDVAVAGL